MKRWLVFALLGVAAHAGAQRSFDHDILKETFGFDESTKKSVALEDLKQGCSARDCIPSIDGPKYVAASEADHVADDAVVIAISYGGEHRAYPARILDHHEIVNDTIAGEPIAITWCALCGSAVGIRRDVGGQVTEFGVSGVLYNSDLVLYDRSTESPLQEQPTYRHEFDGTKHVVTLQDDGTVSLRRGEDIFEPIRLYWFAWYTFNPQTELVK